MRVSHTFWGRDDIYIFDAFLPRSVEQWQLVLRGGEQEGCYTESQASSNRKVIPFFIKARQPFLPKLFTI